MKNVKHNLIAFWLTHIFLRRIGKRYPEFFNKWIADITDSKVKRKIMSMRYVGDEPMKFESIALTLNISPRRVFEHHKSVIDKIISA